MMMNKLDISIIVPLYHGNIYIKGITEQIERALARNRYSAELILVNDSPEIPVPPLPPSDRFEIKVYEEEKNEGIHGARVFGCGQARGEYILFLDQDDIIETDYFEEQIRNTHNVDVSVCGCINGVRREFPGKRYGIGEITLEGMITEGNFIRSPGQALVRREAIPKEWKRNQMKKNGADDWLLWIMMLAMGRRFSCIDKVLFTHTIHGSNTSGNSLEMYDSEHEMIRIIRDNAVISNSELKKLKTLIELQDRKSIAEYGTSEKKAYIFRKMYEISFGRDIYEGKINQYDKIYIYGFGEMGRFIQTDLIRRDYTVEGFIDRDADNIFSNERIIKSGEELPYCDVIIVSNINGSNGIIMELNKIYNTKIVSIYDLIGDAN